MFADAGQQFEAAPLPFQSRARARAHLNGNLSRRAIADRRRRLVVRGAFLVRATPRKLEKFVA